MSERDHWDGMVMGWMLAEVADMIEGQWQDQNKMLAKILEVLERIEAQGKREAGGDG